GTIPPPIAATPRRRWPTPRGRRSSPTRCSTASSPPSKATRRRPARRAALPAPEAALPPTLWFDVTTSWHERGRRPNGTLRVQRTYAGEAGDRLGPRLRFCRYDRATGRFRPMPADAVERLGGAVPSGGPRRRDAAWREAGRLVERGVRRAWRAALP